MELPTRARTTTTAEGQDVKLPLPSETETSLQSIQGCVRAFTKALHYSFPLKSYRDHHDEEKLRNAAMMERDKFLQIFQEKKKVQKKCDRDLEKELLSQIERITEEHLQRNRDFKAMSESILKKREEDLCKQFKKTCEAHIIVKPDMTQESLQELLANGKSLALKKFEHLSNFSLYEEHRQILSERLNLVGNELLEDKKRLSTDLEERKKSMNVKKIILDMARKLQSEVNAAHGIFPKHVLNEMVQNIRNFVKKEGVIFNFELNSALLETLDVATGFLDSHEIMSPSAEDAIQWAEEFEMELQFDFEDEMELELLHMPPQEGNIAVQDGAFELDHDCFDLDTFLAIDNIEVGDFELEKCAGFTIESDYGVEKQSELDFDFVDREEGEGSKNDCVDDVNNTRTNTNPCPCPEPISKNEEATECIPGSDGDKDIKNGGKCLQKSNVGLKRSYSQVLSSGTTNGSGDAKASPGIGILKRLKLQPPEDEGAREKSKQTMVKVDETSVRKSSRIKQRSLKLMNLKAEPKPVSEVVLNFNGSSKRVEFPLLWAIYDGRNVTSIRKMLNDGANPNIKSKDCVKSNAAHEVIGCLIDKRMTSEKALEILNLLVAKGFNLIDDVNSNGIAPLHLVMEVKNLDERLMTWFYDNGADFNAVIGSSGESVLLRAIMMRQGPGIIQKLLDLGANPGHVNILKENAIQTSLLYGHQSAFEIFIDKLDVNARNFKNETALHLVFRSDAMNHEKCLRLLIERGADFFAEYQKGFSPLIVWIIDAANGEYNPFPTLMNVKEVIPVTEDMASAALTVIVEGMTYLRELLIQSLVLLEFIEFLIKEKGAKLRLRLTDEAGWKKKEQSWRKLGKVLMAPKLTHEIKVTTSTWKGFSGEELFFGIKTAIQEGLGLQKGMTSNRISIETVLLSLLNCKEYMGFVEFCRFLKSFCKSVGEE